MLQPPQRIEAQRLDKVAKLQMLLHHGDVGLAVLVEHVHRDADFHGFLRFVWQDCPTAAAARQDPPMVGLRHDEAQTPVPFDRLVRAGHGGDPESLCRAR
jgi:hypothetical protein